MRKFAFIFCFLVILLASFLYWGQLSLPHESFIEGACGIANKTPKDLKVISYNIAFGFGLESERSGIKEKGDIEKNLDNISRFLKSADADIVLLQEVDLASRRSYYINEAKLIAERAGFGCYACITNWIKNYVPYPYWPPAKQYGRMKSGQCILSKFPIKNNVRISLPQRTDKPSWYTAFYFDRAIQTADILINGKNLKVLNAHLEPFDIKNREEQGRMLSRIIAGMPVGRLIAGGDFNALPPDATIKKNFADKPEKWWNEWADVSGDKTMEQFISANPNLKEAGEGITNENETFTYPADSPTRRVDYLFFRGMQKKSGKILAGTGPISDHLPVYLELGL